MAPFKRFASLFGGNKKQEQPVRQYAPQRQSANIAPAPGAPAPDGYSYRGSMHDYFAATLQSCFPDCTLGCNVSVSQLRGGVPATSSWLCACGTSNTGNFCGHCGARKPSGNTWCCPCGAQNTGSFCEYCGTPRPNNPNTGSGGLTFVLYRNGRPCCAVILCSSKAWDTGEICAAMSACKAAGVPCLRFMENFRNQSGYVVNRIRKAMR